MTQDTYTDPVSEVTRRIRESVRAKLNESPGMDDEEVRKLVENAFDDVLNRAGRDDPETFQFLSSLNFRERREIKERIYETVKPQGLGLLAQIISDSQIDEIMINGYQDIFVEKNGRLRKLDKHFESQEELTTIVTNFVSRTGHPIDQAEHPIVDTHLKEENQRTSRVNVVMPPIAINGPIVTIRRFPEKPMTVQDLINRGSITSEVAEVLELLVRAKYNIFVSGGTGSGKTTFLNALSNFIPHDERIITIEDTLELQITNIDNLVRLETRAPGSNGKGEVNITQLIKSALRMRPDRIVVGEVRGGEALDMLQAMNTGHDGSLSTGHANSTRDMLRRLETMVLQGATELPYLAVCQQIASAVDIIIHLSRLRDKSRRTMAISEVLDYDMVKQDYKLNLLYEFRETSHPSQDEVIGSLVRTENKMKYPEKLRNAGIYREI